MFKKLLVGLSMAVLMSAAGDSRVADAAQQGDRAAVKTLIAQKADVNGSQGDGMTALHWAAFKDDAEMAQMLLAAGANPKAETRIGGLTPLFMACTSGNAAIVEALLKAGADANSKNSNGSTALMLASASGNPAAVKALLDHGADVNAKESAHGQTALMFAASENRADVIKLLASKGADVKLASTVVRVGKNPFDDPELNPQPDADKPADAPKPPPPPKPAAAKAKAPAKQNSVFDNAAIGRAVAGKGQRMGGNSATVMGGLSPLSFAARDGRMEAVQALVESGADVNQVTEGDKSSPMVLALVNGHYDVAKYLLDKGADPNLANIDGLAPLMALVDMRYAPVGWVPNPKTDQEKIDGLDLMKALIAKGANVNQRLVRKLWFRPNTHNTIWINIAGATPFWRAAQSSDLEAMKILKAAGADVNMPTLDNDTPLIVAAGMGWAAGQSQNAPDSWLKTVKFLVEECNADVNAIDDFGYTAMHGAAFRGDNEMVQYLADKGAKLDVKSIRGQYVTDMANGPIVNADLPVEHPETVALLMKLGAPAPVVFGPNHR